MTTTVKKWNDEAVEKLLAVVGSESPVSAETVAAAAVALDTSTRSISAKLRQLEREVVSMAKNGVATFSADETAALAQFVNDNAGQFTFKEIAEHFMEGAFNSKQIQGKLLAMEMTGAVKPAEKVEAARTYSAEEEATVISMVQQGAFIEDIAAAVGKELPSVRGKALSLVRAGLIEKIPTQRESYAKNTDKDPIEALGDISGMSVEEIAKATDKTPRGIRTLLTRRGIKVSDYDGEAKRAKAEGKAKEATA